MKQREQELKDVRFLARTDFIDGLDKSVDYVNDSGLYYEYINHQKMLKARIKRGDNDCCEY